MFARLAQSLKPRTPRGKRFFTGIGFLLVAVLTSVSIFATGPAATPTERTEKAWPVSVIEVVPTSVQPTFAAYGRVESSNLTHLRTDLNAEIESVHAREGDWVQAGDVLIILNDRELQLNLLEKRADLTQLEAILQSTHIELEMFTESTEHYRSMRQVAQNKLDRHEDLMAKRLISQGLLDEVIAQANQANIQYQSHMRGLADFPNQVTAQRAAIARAQAQVSQAELDIAKTRITAPFSGPVLGVFVAQGDRSNIGSTLADIADAKSFEIRLQVPQRYGPRLHENLQAGLPVVATTPGGLELALSRLSGQVKQGQSGLDAFFELNVSPGDPETALGRLLELAVTLPQEQAVVALPVQSIYENDRIYSVEDNRLHAITIERVGEVRTPDGQYRILVRSPAITPGQRIITTQLPRAISGLLVEPA
jgi:HlyD family secretion protein